MLDPLHKILLHRVGVIKLGYLHIEVCDDNESICLVRYHQVENTRRFRPLTVNGLSFNCRLHFCLSSTTDNTFLLKDRHGVENNRQDVENTPQKKNNCKNCRQPAFDFKEKDLLEHAQKPK